MTMLGVFTFIVLFQCISNVFASFSAAVASLVVEHGLEGMWVSVVTARELSSVVSGFSRAQAQGCGPRA